MLALTARIAAVWQAFPWTHGFAAILEALAGRTGPDLFDLDSD